MPCLQQIQFLPEVFADAAHIADQIKQSAEQGEQQNGNGPCGFYIRENTITQENCNDNCAAEQAKKQRDIKEKMAEPEKNDQKAGDLQEKQKEDHCQPAEKKPIDPSDANTSRKQK